MCPFFQRFNLFHFLLSLSLSLPIHRGKRKRVYWISFMDGLQRVLLLTTSRGHVKRVSTHGGTAKEPPHTELSLSLIGTGLSLVDDLRGQEITYIGIPQYILPYVICLYYCIYHSIVLSSVVPASWNTTVHPTLTVPTVHCPHIDLGAWSHFHLPPPLPGETSSTMAFLP